MLDKNFYIKDVAFYNIKKYYTCTDSKSSMDSESVESDSYNSFNLVIYESIW